MYYVYILMNKSNERFYVGHAYDLKKECGSIRTTLTQKLILLNIILQSLFILNVEMIFTNQGPGRSR